LQELVDKALEVEFEEVEIFSNLTRVPDWLFLPGYEEIKLATSFYSFDSAVHDRICGAKDSFRRTVDSIRKVVEAGFTLRAGFIEMEANAGHFATTKEFLGELGVTAIGHDAVRQFGRGEKNKSKCLDELCGKCSNGNLSVDVNGAASACIMSKPWPFGNVLETSLEDLYGSEARRRFVDDLRSALEKRAVTMDQPCFPDTCNPQCDPATCSPNCHPSCYPGQGCNPCSPQGGGPCYPSGRCGPF
jgi:MoaA/NifB/PqqE/SkfB family radical SAM enzyme